MSRCLRGSVSRRTAAAVAAGAGVVAALVALPSRGQQPQPELPLARVIAPATAAPDPTTPVSLEFTLPPGARLVRNPRLRVVNSKNELWELLPTYISQLPPAGRGFRGLHTENYPPDIYRVRAEAEYVLLTGQRGTVISPEVTLTVTTSPAGA